VTILGVIIGELAIIIFLLLGIVNNVSEKNKGSSRKNESIGNNGSKENREDKKNKENKDNKENGQYKIW